MTTGRPDMDLDAIERRIAAIAEVDWTVSRDDGCEVYYSQWVHIGPVIIEDLDEIHADAAYDWSPKTQQHAAAVVDFLAHAAADIRALLDALDNRGLK